MKQGRHCISLEQSAHYWQQQRPAYQMCRKTCSLCDSTNTNEIDGKRKSRVNIPSQKCVGRQVIC
eukprot:6468796-Ditylum_brightwellii.AAC.1